MIYAFYEWMNLELSVFSTKIFLYKHSGSDQSSILQKKY